ncbi:coiled-coil domain-containing protein 78 isoform X4 [Acanthochromis polyacanthus]|uniref:coiled-coil domain-containing protein 78 isoform X4 n=1 Tax=Acanthochromis polyacanthus TaxID=80966 RepID=UPI002234E850|nr:coiled-coil domain-containing protein 78 isoform X4 [Acanthochromis polyacanthus]
MLVQSEEERLKISKELVEEKIQTNKMREQYEEETFELKNKILNQDGVITELQMQRDKLLQELQSAEARLKVTEKSGQDLTEDYATLKNSYLVLTEAHDKELAQSEELSAELLALARNQDALRRQLEEQQQSVKTTTQGLHGELDRVRALISRMSHNRVKPEDLAALDKEQKTMEKTLLGNQDEIKETLEKMKNSYEEQQKKLEEKVVAMSKEQQQNNRAMHVSQQKLSEQSAALVCSQSQMKEVEEENSKLQLQVKELHEEYRARLVCYLQDLADYIDGLKDSKSTSEHSKMRTFVDSMLQDVRSSYRAREEQLASAARSYKKRLQKITKTHHALLIAYRVQRAQILTSSETSLDPGPPEANFSLEPTELRDETEKELQQLRQDKARLEGQLQMAASKMPVQNSSRQEQPGQICEESWLDMKKQLREITDSTLVDFERERALLVTRATVAEAQVMELQDYVDDHLSRYKQEITHLHRLHGMEEAGHSQSAHSSHH